MTAPTWRCQHVTRGARAAEVIVKMHNCDPTKVEYVWHVLLCIDCASAVSQQIRLGTIDATPETP